MSGDAAVLVAAVLVGTAVLVAPGRRRPRTSSTPGVGRPAERPPAVDAALVLDLVAAVVEGGAPPLAAVRAVGRVLREAGSAAGEHLERGAVLPPGPADPSPAGRPPDELAPLLAPLGRCLALAEQTGAPVAALLRSAADELRRRRRRASALAAARLGVRVVAPLGLCTLPAFALLAVVPVLLSLGQDLLTG